MTQRYAVDVFYDPEANVWVALGLTLLGLAIEGRTLQQVKRRVWAVAPELLELNHGLTRPCPKDILDFRVLPGPPED